MKSLMTFVLAAMASAAEPTSKNEAPHSALPSGNGIAAAYQADVGIASHEAVIFADGFESGDFSAWDEKEAAKKGVFSYPNPNAAAFGKHCLRVEAHLGKDTGGGPTKWFASSPDLYVRFYTKFDSDCDYVHHFVTLRANKGLRGGDKWSGFGGAGLKPEGDERFSTALEPWGDWAKNPAPGRWNFYSYWHEMKPSKDGKFWGNSFLAEDSQDIKKNEWICAEFLLRHNTPGIADGEQAYWIDGKLLGHWKGINWRKSDTLWANALTLESYITDRWTKNPVNVVFFDNVVIAKRYIGPALP